MTPALAVIGSYGVERDRSVLGASVMALAQHITILKLVRAAVLRRDPVLLQPEVHDDGDRLEVLAPFELRVASHIDTDKHGKPAFLAVITGWGYAYRRPDDVLVVPIGALVP